MPDAEVLMPMNHLDASMKTGRVAFAWSSLSQWITPTPPSVSHETGEMLVELPLSVVAPLYMARRRPGTAQKKVVVPESIPGVFSGTATSEAPAEAAPAPPPAPTSKLGNLLGQPTKLDWPPQDVTKHVCMIDGVAGTLIASADGLPVSGQMPSHINCDTLAAFVPQMFSRMSQSAAEMRLGTVTMVMVTAGHAPYAILRAGKLYMVVLGRSGQALPDFVLQQIAAELADINQ